MKKDYIFQCKKCEHIVYVHNINKFLKQECPECGEEFQGNWIFIGIGEFKK